MSAANFKKSVFAIVFSWGKWSGEKGCKTNGFLIEIFLWRSYFKQFKLHDVLNGKVMENLCIFLIFPICVFCLLVCLFVCFFFLIQACKGTILYILPFICVCVVIYNHCFSVCHNNKFSFWPTIPAISFHLVEIVLIYIHSHMIRIWPSVWLFAMLYVQ